MELMAAAKEAENYEVPGGGGGWSHVFCGFKMVGFQCFVCGTQVFLQFLCFVAPMFCGSYALGAHVFGFPFFSPPKYAKRFVGLVFGSRLGSATTLDSMHQVGWCVLHRVIPLMWVWLKIKQEGLRRCLSMFSLTRVPFWYR